MKICFPARSLEGLASSVFEHFGSAPGFVIVDTENMNVEEVTNGDLHHAHGMCQPLKALGGRQVDAVAVSGIGMGALMRLQAQGIQVFRAVPGTVEDNIRLMNKNQLEVFQLQHTCSGHSQGGCAHH